MTEQWTLPLEIREFEPRDYDRLIQVYNSLYPDYERSVNEWRHWDESLDKTKYHFQRYTCRDSHTGEAVGFGQAQHSPEMFHPQKFWLELIVDPDHQRKGVGSAIYQHLASHVEKMSAVKLWTMVKEDMPRSVKFASDRGFMESHRAWESRLNPSKFNLADWEKYSTKVSNQGITISTLADEQHNDPECYNKLYDLEQEASADIPRPDKYTSTTYQQWYDFIIKNPSLIPEGQLIAKDGNNYVGLSTVWRADKEPHGLYQGLTGVRRAYRSRGIAIALKLKVIEFAQRNGYDLIKTWNDTTNAAMLGINIKLGFVRRIGWILFQKSID